MITQTFENKRLGLKSHVIMMRFNKKIQYGVDVFNTAEHEFIPHVEFFPTEKKAVRYAKICVV
ncbi:MAG: hypothetical protein JRD89_15805 [Deltaproteobacteria bacterium]|nr:hypothetical protein [Deltaproteobacteria bacterium]